MRILKDQSACLVIDIQERLYPHIANYETVGANATILIQGVKLLNLPVFVTQQYTKGLGKTIEPIAQVVGTHDAFEKISFSCCGSADFMGALSQSEKRFVILCGIETHVCVLQTALDLLDRGYIPVIVENCTGSRKTEDKQIAIARMRYEGAIITSYESLLFELCREAGTDVFKKISALVK